MDDLQIKVQDLCKADPYFDKLYHRSIDFILNTFDLFGGINGTCFSFNGGKDSTVVLHLLRLALAKRPLNGDKDTNYSFQKLKIIYFDSPDQFPEVETFIKSTIKRYNLMNHVFKNSYKEGIKEFLTQISPEVKAVFMGVRKGDPWTDELEHFTPSSNGWPLFMRVNPILKWSYSQVWKFLRHCELEYCPLYDEGYTSLGNIRNTVKNKLLLINEDNNKEEKYLPAYALLDEKEERAGRP